MKQGEISFRTLEVLPEQIETPSDRDFYIRKKGDRLLFLLRTPNNLWIEISVPVSEILQHLPPEVATLNNIADKIPIGILIFKEEIVYSNGFIEKILEKEKEKFTNHAISEVFPKEIGKNLKKLLNKNYAEKQLTLKWIGPIETSSRNERVLLIIATSVSLQDEPIGVAFFFDITAERHFLEKMGDIYSYDPITRLPNFKKALEFIENLRKQRRKFIVGIVDIDKFYVINNSLGIETGDKILRMFANRLKRSFRTDSYWIFRMISDKFIIISLNNEKNLSEEVSTIVSKVKKILEKPFKAAGREIFLNVKFGFSSYPEHGDAVLTKAEVALNTAKESGSEYLIFSRELETSGEILEILKQIKDDLKNNRITVFFQPKVDLKTGYIKGAEALMRCSVPPAQAIPVMTRYGLLFDIGNLILSSSLRTLKNLLEEGYNISMAVNISISQLLDPRFLPKLKYEIEKAEIPPEKLILEVTESEATINLKQVFETIKELVNYGVKISIDDFGTGYSSLSRLKLIKAHELKIDTSFVRNLPESDEDKKIVKFILEISELLNMTSVAEGIEKREQLEFLKREGCSLGQGFLFSPAVPEEEFRKLLKKRFEV
ncbi:putative bifunctional diguanylate cyclase/phosphodiesterase [Phorcysia thermohydrogeniphila]|uniref:Diguanylate cyclase (GGDEF)-like protein n=1 Tax=Phorcysia thermohydrogeniphila TaxID=936138 RepID=A0A4R1G6T2_9BACT|nr:bifunctional diguanylate cyclase/phosphodiesterase [Phorcysia thermohydrogeniphila]TCK03434.1 diguanylate cyclase (GGDEF)-like protein [Phorcysia thermohydrogeniphila]